MKIRRGFVSNSSASSFCIYGWEFKTIKDHFESTDDFEDLLRKAMENVHLVSSNSYDDVIGVGTFDDEIDHFVDEGDDWEDFQSDGPSSGEMAALDKIAKDLKLPEPEFFSDTWFNG